MLDAHVRIFWKFGKRLRDVLVGASAELCSVSLASAVLSLVISSIKSMYADFFRAKWKLLYADLNEDLSAVKGPCAESQLMLRFASKEVRYADFAIFIEF
jgi:hypothetical protein